MNPPQKPLFLRQIGDPGYWRDAAVSVGKFARICFFFALLAGLAAVLQLGDWSAADTPLANLTIAQLARYIATLTASLIGLGIWAMLAWSNIARAYVVWAWIAAAAMIGMLVFAFATTK